MTPFKLIAISSLLALLPMISSCNMKRFTQDDGTLKPIVGMDGTEFYKKKSYTDAIACFKASADQGDAYAQFQLARCYNSDYGRQGNDTLAFKYYKLAADQGNGSAQCTVAQFYREGRGGIKNYMQAIKYLEMASKQGYSNGYGSLRLGLSYEHGHDSIQDNQKALQYYHLASKQGTFVADFLLGQIYGNGKLGVKKNRTLAEKYFDSVAQQDELYCSNIAKLHRYSRDGLKKDINKYIKYAISAAERGIFECYFDLGNLYIKMAKRYPKI